MNSGKKLTRRIMRIALLGITIISLSSCGNSTGAVAAKAGEHPLPDTLKVATLYGPTSYFLYRDEPMGYDYTLVDSLARQKGWYSTSRLQTACRRRSPCSIPGWSTS